MKTDPTPINSADSGLTPAQPDSQSDIQLHSLICGEGEPLLLLHGNGEDSTYFEHQIPFFSRYFQVHAIDSRGHGQSPRGSRPMRISQLARDVLCYMDEHHLQRVHVLGFSDGANIAMAMARQQPERIASMVLNGGNLSPGGVKLSVQLPILTGWALTSLFPKARAKHEILGIMVKDPHLYPEDLSKLQMPVLVIAGSNDMIKESHTRAIAAALPNSCLAIISGTHFAARDNPDMFNHVVREFLARVPSTRPETDGPACV